MVSKNMSQLHYLSKGETSCQPSKVNKPLIFRHELVPDIVFKQYAKVCQSKSSTLYAHSRKLTPINKFFWFAECAYLEKSNRGGI